MSTEFLPIEEHESLRLPLDPGLKGLIETAIEQGADLAALEDLFGEDALNAYYSDPNAQELIPEEY